MSKKERKIFNTKNLITLFCVIIISIVGTILLAIESRNTSVIMTDETSHEKLITATDSVVININTATKEELMLLDHIGEKKAEDIISYRTKTLFKHIEEIMNVNGIGENIFENIKDHICVE